MSSTPKFAQTDTKKPNGFYVQFERLVIDDQDHGPPDWEIDDDRLQAYRNDDWHFVGVRAMAKCLIVMNGVGTYINLESPGLWGIESDSGDEYFNEVFEEEKSSLLGLIEQMKSPIVEAA